MINDSSFTAKCPICGGGAYGLMPIDLPGVTKFGCSKCKLRLTGYFFVHQKPISQTTSCPIGHSINPADSLADGESIDSNRVGWVLCSECRRNAVLWQTEIRLRKKAIPVSQKRPVGFAIQPALF